MGNRKKVWTPAEEAALLAGVAMHSVGKRKMILTDYEFAPRLVNRPNIDLKESNSLPSPKVEGDNRAQARALATVYSHPVWMVRRWTKDLGREEAIKLMKWNNNNPSFSLRANKGKGFTRSDLVSRLEALKMHYELYPHLDDFVRITMGMQVYSKSCP